MARKAKTTPPTLFPIGAPAPLAEDPAVVARRSEYRALLAERLKDPAFRQIEGFPLGADEAIIALSDPPYFTACPNPFLGEWLAERSTKYDPAADEYHREPFAADVSEGKTDPIYNAHSYHTKVPHKAIMRYILHYTGPGDVVYDGFCGTGMTGVAAQLCGDQSQVESLGYHVEPDGSIWEQDSWDAAQALVSDQKNPHPHIAVPRAFSKLGARRAILNDLSPAAAFIAHKYNAPIDPQNFSVQSAAYLDAVESDCGWMYATLHGLDPAAVSVWAERIAGCTTREEARSVVAKIPLENLGRVNSVVSSDVLSCPNCAAQFLFWDEGIDKVAGKVKDVFACPNCSSEVTQDRCTTAYDQVFDRILGTTIAQIRQTPFLIVYAADRRRRNKQPDAFDAALAALIERSPLSDEFPTAKMMGKDGSWGQMWCGAYHVGVTHSHHFFTPRARAVLAAARARAASATDPFFFAWTGVLNRSSRMNRVHLKYFFHGGGGWNAGYMKGTLFLPALPIELSVIEQLRDRVDSVLASARIPGRELGNVIIGAASGASRVDEIAGSVDYIFTDPPFGRNLVYSELNFLWEAALGVRTSNDVEAITSSWYRKTLESYQGVMTECFRRNYALLKPGRWMTVEFHNSANAVWHSIQEALQLAGFIVADVRVLDKQQHSWKQVNSDGATKQDLAISCYKIGSGFEERFAHLLGQAGAVREFVEQHLSMLPVTPLTKRNELERLAERATSILYDRMIAYHLVRGAPVPMSASEFGKLLQEHFVQRDGMWFVAGQEVRYDLCKLRGVDVEQQVLFVSDERSAVSWLRAELDVKQQTLGEMTSRFLQAMKEWPEQEPRPELIKLLRDWFVEVDGRWASPNPDDEKHVEALRTKGMLRLFATYAAGKGKLKEFRREALIEAFRYCWNSSQEAIFVAVCQRIGEKVLREDAQLSEAYDLAVDRVASRPAPVQLEFEWE